MNDKLAKSITDELDGVRREAVETLKKDIEKTVADAKDIIAQASVALGHAGQALAEQAEAQARGMVADARVRARTASDDLIEEVRDNPLTAVGLAIGAGFLVGLLVGGGRR